MFFFFLIKGDIFFLQCDYSALALRPLTLINKWNSYCQGWLKTFATFLYFYLFFGITKCIFKTTERMSYFKKNWSWIGCAICLNNHDLKRTAGLGWVERLMHDWSWVTKFVLCGLRQINEQVISISVFFFQLNFHWSTSLLSNSPSSIG